ncbi:MAG: 7-cyano-7-deazaguanine synthase, partial [uncultured Gemmatimonadaceae bacterium]
AAPQRRPRLRHRARRRPARRLRGERAHVPLRPAPCARGRRRARPRRARTRGAARGARRGPDRVRRLRPHGAGHRGAQGPGRGRDRARRAGDVRAGAQHDLPRVRARLGRGPWRARHLHRRQRAGLLGVPGLPPGVHRRVRAAGRARDRGGHGARRVGAGAGAAAAADEGGDHRPGPVAGRRLRDDDELLRPRAGRRRLRAVRRVPAPAERVRGGRRGRPRALRDRGARRAGV